MADPDFPLVLNVYDKSYAWQRQIGAPNSATFTPRFNGIGTGEIVLDVDDPINAVLQRKGTRLTVDYRGERLDSGRLRQRIGDLNDDGTCTYQFRSDWAWMHQSLGWVMPGGNLAPTSLADDAQSYDPDNEPPGLDSGSGYYPWPPAVSTAEAAIKNLIAVNFARLGRPHAIAPDQGRGGDARAASLLPLVRFAPLDEALDALLTWADLGISIRQNGTGCTVDVWKPRTWATELTVTSGVIPDGTYTITDPEVTRVVLGSNGEDAARAFWPANAPQLEADYGDIIEVFRDATGGQLEWSDDVPDSLKVEKYYLLRPENWIDDRNKYLGYLTTEGAKGLAAGAPTTGLDITLAETDSFHFHGLADGEIPAGYHVGDHITVSAHGASFTEQITEATVAWTASDDGNTFTVTPQVGPIKDDPTQQLAEAVAALAAGQRRIQAAR